MKVGFHRLKSVPLKLKPSPEEVDAAMKFIEVAHPEGGRFIMHIDHITSMHFRPSEGDVKARISFDLDERQHDLVLFGEEAEQAWKAIKKIVAASTSN